MRIAELLNRPFPTAYAALPWLDLLALAHAGDIDAHAATFSSRRGLA